MLKVVYHVIDQELSQPLEVKAMETDSHNTERTIQWLVLHSRTQGLSSTIKSSTIKNEKEIKKKFTRQHKNNLRSCPPNFP